MRVTVKLKQILVLRVPWDLLAEKAISENLKGSSNVVISIWSVDGSILSSMQGRAELSGVKHLQL